MENKLRYFTFQCTLLSTGEQHHFLFIAHDDLDDPIEDIKLQLATWALNPDIPLDLGNLPYLYSSLERTRDEDDY